MTSGSDKYIVCGANSVSSVIEELKATRTLSDPQLLNILSTDKYDQELFSAAERLRRPRFYPRTYRNHKLLQERLLLLRNTPLKRTGGTVQAFR